MLPLSSVTFLLVTESSELVIVYSLVFSFLEQGCGVVVTRSWSFLGEVGFLRILGVRAGFFHPKPEVELDLFSKS